MMHFSARRFIVGTLMIALTVYLGYVVERANFPAFISAYGLFFALYVWLLTRPGWTAADRRFFIGLGIVLRVLLLFSIPNLSDDFYRFLWDGRLAAQGIHPFAHPPVFFMENEIRHAGITPELFSKLNSPEYYTVYPPVCQGVFWLAAVLFPKSVAGGVFVFKVFLVVCELGIIGLLGGFRLSAPPLRHSASLGYACRHSRQPHSQPLPKRKGSRDVHRRLHHLPVQIFKKSGQLYGSPPSWGGVGGGVDAATLYALNPLILLEITGNAHFEGAMLCFLLAGILMLQRGRLVSAAGFWALATATKLVPLLFLPIVWAQLGFWRGLRFLLWFGGFSVLLFAPLIDFQILENMAGSLNLYFRQFAFNASVYYVLKAIGKAVLDPSVDVGRTLGPVLGVLVFLGVLVLALNTRPTAQSRRTGTASNLSGRNFKGEKSAPLAHFSPLKFRPDRLLFAITLYLTLATTVHPWYIALPFGLSLLTRLRYPLVWTGVAMLSYSHYAGGGFQENYWLIAVEYTLLFAFAIWEFRATWNSPPQNSPPGF